MQSKCCENAVWRIKLFMGHKTPCKPKLRSRRSRRQSLRLKLRFSRKSLYKMRPLLLESK